MRDLTVELVYAEETSDYAGAVIRVPSAMLATGPLSVGQAIAFSVGLPTDALPNQSAQEGRVAWQAIAHADIAHGIDANAGAPFELTLPSVS